MSRRGSSRSGRHEKRWSLSKTGKSMSMPKSTELDGTNCLFVVKTRFGSPNALGRHQTSDAGAGARLAPDTFFRAAIPRGRIHPDRPGRLARDRWFHRRAGRGTDLRAGGLDDRRGGPSGDRLGRLREEVPAHFGSLGGGRGAVRVLYYNGL